MTLIFERRKLQTARCRDCRTVVAGRYGLQRSAGEWYMVHDHVWAAAGMEPFGGYLCIGCLSRRLGRSLHWTDFPDYEVNLPDVWQDSNRLDALKRIARHHHAIERANGGRR